MKPSRFQVVRAGTVPYARGWRWQRELARRRRIDEVPDTLLVLDHPPVITLGNRGKESHVLVAEDMLARKGIEVHRVNRGGDVTYHGPGQVVVYTIVHLGQKRISAAQFVWNLEEAMVRVCRDYGVEAHRVPDVTGVFVGQDKVGAVGVHIGRSVTTHGLALNVDPLLEHFELIVPCGLRNHGVTSMRHHLDEVLDEGDVAARLVGFLGEQLLWTGGECFRPSDVALEKSDGAQPLHVSGASQGGPA